MGIFDKKPKRTAADILSELQAKLAEGKKPEKFEIEEVAGGMAISGALPKGFDMTDQAQVKALVTKALKESGVLPEGTDISNVDIQPINLAEPDALDKLMKAHDEGLRKVMESLETAGPEGVPNVPIPQDMLKGCFVKAYNALHHKSHELAPLTRDLMLALEPLRDLARKAGGKELEAFLRFEKHIVNMLMAMSQSCEAICSLGGNIAQRGIPVSDIDNNTVN